MRFTLLLIIFLTLLPEIYGQETVKSDSVKLASLLQRIEMLENKVLKEVQEDELQLLLQQADQLTNREFKKEVDISKKFTSGVRQQQGLNPNISVLGDFFAAYSTENSDIVNEPSERTHGSNGLFMRSMEMAFVAPLDPYTRGKAFIDITEDGVEIEELYMELVNLPLNLSVKGGVFFPEFGLLNRHHTHALPQFDRPRAPVNYFGLDGFNGMGAAVNVLLPTVLFADASSFDASVVR